MSKKTYKIRVTHSVTVTVKAEDEETAIIEAMEMAEDEIAQGDNVHVEPEILNR